jgi:hypothetical protein
MRMPPKLRSPAEAVVSGILERCHISSACGLGRTCTILIAPCGADPELAPLERSGQRLREKRGCVLAAHAPAVRRPLGSSSLRRPRRWSSARAGPLAGSANARLAGSDNPTTGRLADVARPVVTAPTKAPRTAPVPRAAITMRRAFSRSATAASRPAGPGHALGRIVISVPSPVCRAAGRRPRCERAIRSRGWPGGCSRGCGPRHRLASPLSTSFPGSRGRGRVAGRTLLLLVRCASESRLRGDAPVPGLATLSNGALAS